MNRDCRSYGDQIIPASPGEAMRARFTFAARRLHGPAVMPTASEPDSDHGEFEEP